MQVRASASAWQHRGTAGKLEVRWESVCRCLVIERVREERGAFRQKMGDSQERRRSKERECVCVRVIARERE